MPMSEFETERQQLIDRAEAAEAELGFEVQKRLDAEARYAEAMAILDAIQDAVSGKEPSDFMLAFPLVRAIADKETSIRGLIEKWRNRAEPNFADPEATEETLAYWSGAKRCANELEALLENKASNC